MVHAICARMANCLGLGLSWLAAVLLLSGCSRHNAPSWKPVYPSEKNLQETKRLVRILEKYGSAFSPQDVEVMEQARYISNDEGVEQHSIALSPMNLPALAPSYQSASYFPALRVYYGKECDFSLDSDIHVHAASHIDRETFMKLCSPLALSEEELRQIALQVVREVWIIEEPLAVISQTYMPWRAEQEWDKTHYFDNFQLLPMFTLYCARTAELENAEDTYQSMSVTLCGCDASIVGFGEGEERKDDLAEIQNFKMDGFSSDLLE